jgi:hypothetical protein
MFASVFIYGAYCPMQFLMYSFIASKATWLNLIGEPKVQHQRNYNDEYPWENGKILSPMLRVSLKSNL